jgi:hypothetical protein
MYKRRDGAFRPLPVDRSTGGGDRTRIAQSWDITQPSPPSKSMSVVDFCNARTTVVGIKRIVML